MLIVGNATILFGIWDIVKVVLNLTVNDILSESIEKAGADLSPKDRIFSVILAFILVGIVTLVSISIRLIVGRTAIRIGKGEDRKCGAMVFWTVFLIIFSGAGIPLSVYGLLAGEDILNMAGSLLIDTTSFITLIGMLLALHKIKKLTKQAGEGNAA